MEPICTREDITTPPNDKHLAPMHSQLYSDTFATGIHHPSNALTEDPMSATIHLNNFTDHPYTLKKGSHIASFSVKTPELMEYFKPIERVTTWHLLQKKIENSAFYVSS